MPKISVIIPTYNVEKYLHECMDSVIYQTLKDIEIICIDDGSTDSSGVILDEYAGKDKRIKVVHKENQGYGKAVNVGIDMAQGEYIGIVEPDDYIADYMMQSLYEAAQQYGTDIVKGDYIEFYGQGHVNEKYVRVSQYDDLYGKPFKVREHLEIFKSEVSNWSGIYKKTFLDKYNIRHQETPGASYQDAGFYFLCHAYADTMYLIQKPVYYYRQDNANSSVASKGKIYCVCDEYEYIKSKLVETQDMSELAEPYQYKKMQGVVAFTIFRIVEELREEYIKAVSNIYKQDMQEGIFRLGMLSDEQKKSIILIKDAPDEFYNKYRIWHQTIEEVISKYEKVILYGAGGEGKRIMNVLPEELKNKIIGFAVSSGKDNFTEYMGKPVNVIEHYLDMKEDVLVMTAVTERYRNEIQSRLERLGFANIY